MKTPHNVEYLRTSLTHIRLSDAFFIPSGSAAGQSGLKMWIFLDFRAKDLMGTIRLQLCFQGVF